MLKFDLHVKLGRVTSGAKIAVSAFNWFVITQFMLGLNLIHINDGALGLHGKGTLQHDARWYRRPTMN